MAGLADKFAVATSEIRKVLSSLNGGALIYAGLSNSTYIRRSSDGGASWYAYPTGQTYSGIYAIAVDKVRYVGEPVVAVAAVSRQVAERPSARTENCGVTEGQGPTDTRAGSGKKLFTCRVHRIYASGQRKTHEIRARPPSRTGGFPEESTAWQRWREKPPAGSDWKVNCEKQL